MKQATDQKEEKNSEMMCESSGLFVILHQQWRGGGSGTGRDGAGRGGTNPSFTGETPGNEHIVHINI